MGELVIATHDFEKSKNELKASLAKVPKNLEFQTVKISGGFLGIRDHKVTGYELNDTISQVQDYLMKFNQLNTNFIKEFGQVYNALEALDNDYIQAILIAIKAAEKANDDVKIAQNDISKTIGIQKKTINVLKQFKEEIEGFEHIKDIDIIWDDALKMDQELLSLNSEFANLKEKIYKNEHLDEVDEIWNSCKVFEKDMASTTETVNTHNGDIENLKREIKMVHEKNEERSQEISKKLNIAYALASSSIGIAMIELVLLLVGIL